MLCDKFPQRHADSVPMPSSTCFALRRKDLVWNLVDTRARNMAAAVTASSEDDDGLRHRFPTRFAWPVLQLGSDAARSCRGPGVPRGWEVWCLRYAVVQNLSIAWFPSSYEAMRRVEGPMSDRTDARITDSPVVTGLSDWSNETTLHATIIFGKVLP